MNIGMYKIRIMASLVILAALMIVAAEATAFAEDSGVNGVHYWFVVRNEQGTLKEIML